MRVLDLVVEEASVDALPEYTRVFLKTPKFYVLELVGILLGAFEKVVVLEVVLGSRDVV